MTRPESALHVEVLDDEFVITMPGTSYKVTFRKLAGGPGLSASHKIRDDPDTPITRSEFLARAWRVANDKARVGVDRLDPEANDLRSRLRRSAVVRTFGDLVEPTKPRLPQVYGSCDSADKRPPSSSSRVFCS